MAGQGGLAQEIRAGLEVAEQKPSVVMVDELEELFHQKPVRQHIYEFVVVFDIVFVLLALYDYRRTGSVSTTLALLSIALVLTAVGSRRPIILKPVWKNWIALGEAMGMVMSYIILSLVWIALFIPMALMLRALKKKIMETAFREDVPSYWKTKNEAENDFALLKRQY